MSFSTVIEALAIPREAIVDQRVPKKMLVEQGAPTAADKRKILDGIEELHWVAALKPTNIGVPVFKDATREYLEIVVLTAQLRASAKAARLVELIHRAIPYPLLLLSAHNGSVAFSMSHKRWSQLGSQSGLRSGLQPGSYGEGGKVVLEDFRQLLLTSDAPSPLETAFLQNITVSSLPSRDLFTLYDGWLGRLAALEAARITGTFRLPESPERAVVVSESLGMHARLKRELAILRASADRQKQLNRRVQLNLEIKRLEAELAATQQTL